MYTHARFYYSQIKKASKHDHEIQHSHTADQPTTLQG